MLLVFMLLKKFKATLREAEYSARNTKNSVVEHVEATRSHPLLFSEDRPSTLFTELWGFRLGIGAKREAVARSATITVTVGLVFVTFSRTRGKIFCHVITIIIEVSFSLIDSISFMYHRWRGHAPIFIRTLTVRTKVATELSN